MTPPSLPSSSPPASSAAASSSSSAIAQTLWAARIPVQVTHASRPDGPALVTSIPRFSYLALLLPRLAAFFGGGAEALPCSGFRFEGVPLRNLPAGLLLDLYRPGRLPWRLTVDGGAGWDIADTFLNGAKEADFVRYGNANQIMKMSKAHTTQLWQAVVDNDGAAHAAVQARLLDAPVALRHVPLRVYVPAPPTDADAAASFRVLQSLVPAAGPDRRPRLLGQALKELMPRLFPSSRDPVLAAVILHGAPVPFQAPLVDLMREAAYPDGWLCFVVVV
ncbi:hypothetical protein CDD83_10254 [Cordyceps sp. RAO-2017]|nr:hypothetical protein CDD83_10254 [Cordyceps sp. RAO-2017]